MSGSQAITEFDFHRTMKVFQSECQQASDRWVGAVDPHAYFRSKRDEFLTRNMSKSMNSCLKMSRKLPNSVHGRENESKDR